MCGILLEQFQNSFVLPQVRHVEGEGIFHIAVGQSEFGEYLGDEVVEPGRAGEGHQSAMELDACGSDGLPVLRLPRRLPSHYGSFNSIQTRCLNLIYCPEGATLNHLTGRHEIRDVLSRKSAYEEAGTENVDDEAFPYEQLEAFP